MSPLQEKKQIVPSSTDHSEFLCVGEILNVYFIVHLVFESTQPDPLYSIIPVN